MFISDLKYDNPGCIEGDMIIRYTVSINEIANFIKDQFEYVTNEKIGVSVKAIPIQIGIGDKKINNKQLSTLICLFNSSILAEDSDKKPVSNINKFIEYSLISQYLKFKPNVYREIISKYNYDIPSLIKYRDCPKDIYIKKTQLDMIISYAKPRLITVQNETFVIMALRPDKVLDGILLNEDGSFIENITFNYDKKNNLISYTVLVRIAHLDNEGNVCKDYNAIAINPDNVDFKKILNL